MANGDAPYFEHAETVDYIEALADQESLLVYAGAGVSIDRTNVRWEDLIRGLMKDRVDTAELRKRLERESPLQSASIVKQLYIESHKGEAATEDAIAEAVRQLLYADLAYQLRRAGIAQSVARLIAEMNRKGLELPVVTTNYDDCLQQEISLLNDKDGDTPIQIETHVPNLSLGEIDAEVGKILTASATGANGISNKIVHLHGYLPRARPGGEDITWIVLSELDYAKAYPVSSRILEGLFRERSVLILGSSLIDPPLVNALATTKQDAIRNGLKRVAVVPIQGFGVSGNTATDMELRSAIKENIRQRMGHFEVKVTFPDFYSQVAQFVTEIQIASHTGSYRGTPNQYGARLSAWWHRWHDARSGDWSDANRRDHAILRQCLDDLQREPGLEDELRYRSLELEIWVRWKPGSRSRQLRLWASSEAAWPEIDARTADIATNSEYVSVRTFSNGRIDHHPLDQSRRDRRYLCVPIRLGESDGTDLPVAIISFAYGPAESDLDRKEELSIGSLARIAEKIPEAGLVIADSRAS